VTALALRPRKAQQITTSTLCFCQERCPALNRLRGPFSRLREPARFIPPRRQDSHLRAMQDALDAQFSAGGCQMQGFALPMWMPPRIGRRGGQPAYCLTSSLARLRPKQTVDDMIYLHGVVPRCNRRASPRVGHRNDDNATLLAVAAGLTTLLEQETQALARTVFARAPSSERGTVMLHSGYFHGFSLAKESHVPCISESVLRDYGY